MKEKPLDIGILGAGQLSWMLAQAAEAQGHSIGVLSNEARDPAAQLPLESFKNLDPLLRSSRSVLFESEFIDIEKLRPYEAITRFVPGLDAIKPLQDKLNQKKIFEELQIPSAKYWPLGSDLQLSLSQLPAKEDLLMFKWSRFGYDGKGNFLSSAETSPELISFIQKAGEKGAQVYAEQKIEFSAELALVLCRSQEKISFLPMVYSKQKNAACEWVWGPARKLGLEANLESEARAHLAKIAEKLKLEGCLAGEFFLTEDGRLLINELAPRVHNSAHFSLDACDLSQFDLQILSATGAPLRDPNLKFAYFGMKNLLSPFSSGSIHIPAKTEELEFGQAKLYWYGKSDLKKNRKMGHINFWADDQLQLKELESKIRNWESLFWQNLKK